MQYKGAYPEFCLQSAKTSLLFGNVTFKDERANGDDCIGAVEWDGKPMCLSTKGKTKDNNLLGYAGTGATFGSLDGKTCPWNGSPDNTTWVKFKAISNDPICLTISGIEIGKKQQSIIVTDPNTDLYHIVICTYRLEDITAKNHNK